MIKIGIVTYNKYCNFTNYGSALQSWALFSSIEKLGPSFGIIPFSMDYCPDILKNKNALCPIKNMWDKDDESQKMVEMSMPAIKANYKKFCSFYQTKFRWSPFVDSSSFDRISKEEKINVFVCGSDTIFCNKEFGYDDGYYANFPIMKSGYSFSYAASFGDSDFSKEKDCLLLSSRLNNFKALGIRENTFIPLVKKTFSGEVTRVIDPTLLLTKNDYEQITSPRLVNGDYLLLYSRRNDPIMERFADDYAKKTGLKVVEISLKAANKDHHLMFYEAGVEEFLSLTKYAKYVVTNSFHGAIFAIQFHRQFTIFSREQADDKISQLLSLTGTEKASYSAKTKSHDSVLDYQLIDRKIELARKNSISFLVSQLQKASQWKVS
jgi:hypothetical protein